MKNLNILIIYHKLGLIKKGVGSSYARDRDKLLGKKHNLFVLQPETQNQNEIAQINQKRTYFFPYPKIFNKIPLELTDLHLKFILHIRNICRIDNIDIIINVELFGSIAPKVFTKKPVIYDSHNWEAEFAKSQVHFDNKALNFLYCKFIFF